MGCATPLRVQPFAWHHPIISPPFSLPPGSYQLQEAVNLPIEGNGILFMKTMKCLKFSLDSLIMRQKTGRAGAYFPTARGTPDLKVWLERRKPFKMNGLEKSACKLQKSGMTDAIRDSMMHKVSILPAMVLLLATAIAAKVRAMIDAQIPMGYQDETGFHAGEKPPRDSNWSPLW